VSTRACGFPAKAVRRGPESVGNRVSVSGFRSNLHEKLRVPLLRWARPRSPTIGLVYGALVKAAATGSVAGSPQRWQRSVRGRPARIEAAAMALMGVVLLWRAH
jgi:hypothetical protein